MEVPEIKLQKLIGYRGWKVWTSYDMHISLLSLYYILIVDNLIRPLDSLVLISSLGFYFMYGFLINDFCDRSNDMAVGKKRIIHEIPEAKLFGLIFLLIFISVLHLLYLKNILYSIVYITAYLLATFYSAPPIKFKNRGLSGIIVNGLIEKALPVLGVFVYFDHFGFDTLMFVIASFLVEIVEIVTHQIDDYESDLRTDVHTFVVGMGIEKTLKIYSSFIGPITGIVVAILCLLIALKVRYSIFFIAVGFISYPVLTLLISTGKLSRKKKVIPFYFSCLYVLINSVLPLFFASILTLNNIMNIVLLLVALGTQYYILKYNYISIKNKTLIHYEIFTET